MIAGQTKSVLPLDLLNRTADVPRARTKLMENVSIVLVRLHISLTNLRAKAYCNCYRNPTVTQSTGGAVFSLIKK